MKRTGGRKNKVIWKERTEGSNDARKEGTQKVKTGGRKKEIRKEDMTEKKWGSKKELINAVRKDGKKDIGDTKNTT